MKFKALLAAAALGVTVLGAVPANADAPDYRRGPDYSQDYRGDRGEWRGDNFRGDRHGPRRPSLTVVTQRGAISLQRDDRLFYTFTSAPYHFQPGFTYEYTDRCNRRGCVVNVYRGHSDYRVDRIFAPYAPRIRQDYAQWRGDDWRRDGWRGDGERYQRDRDDDLRDRDGRGLEGGPRTPR
ncbi:MAG: hypothetical protein ABW199_12605 [Caulobacterales bacterium]